MVSERGVTGLSILLAVLVVGTAAAGVADDAAAAGGDGSAGLGVGTGSGFGAGDDSAFGFNVTGSVPHFGFPGWVVATVLGGMLSAAAIVTVGYYAFLVWRRRTDRLVDEFAAVALRIVGLVLFVGGLVLLMALVGQLFGPGGGGLFGSTPGEAPPGEEGRPATSLDSPLLPPLLVLAGGLLFVGLLLVVGRDGGDGNTDAAVEPVPDPPSPSPARGRSVLSPLVAEDEAVGNDVYRAWEALARDVDATGATTPAEVERDAVSAGYEPEAVAALTDLFRETRYGDAGIDAERERRARALAERLTDARDVKP